MRTRQKTPQPHRSLWDMNRQQRPITDRELKAWLAAGPVDRGVGEGLTFVAKD